MDRRTFLRTGGTAAVGLTITGCMPRGLRTAPAPARHPVNLVPVDVSWDRVIRTTVGLRPHRDSGFVVRADRLDEKTLIHNYGHGGAGMSLGWGTGYLATELALAQPERRAAVIGCGMVGLTAARQLQRHGFDVTIYAKALPPERYPIVDIPLEHGLFHMLYDIRHIPQIPSIGAWGGPGGNTSERRDSQVPHVRGILDENGRIMVLMTHNTDFGDAFEREGEDHQYFLAFAPDGYAFGVNAIIYSMTH